VLRVLREAAPWPAVLSPAGYEPTSRGRVQGWRRGDVRLDVGVDPARGWQVVSSVGTGVHWARNGRPCDFAFVRMHHRGDRTAAVDDLIAAANGDDGASPVARSLPANILAGVREAASAELEAFVRGPASPQETEVGTVAASQPSCERTSQVRRSGLLRLTAAADITPVSQSWLWDRRIPVGALTLLAGREQVGKSTCSLALAADVTQGRLEGEHFGVPGNVVVVATEDSWATTIVPRLMAAGGDLNRVLMLTAVSASDEEQEGVLTLPESLTDFEHLVVANSIVLAILDPLMSRLGATLDTHRDGAVRQALEPLVAVAQRTRVAVLGLIHVNKTTTTDPLTSVMASRAFTAVPRSILFAASDADEPDVRYLELVKSNLTSTELPSLTYSVESAAVQLPTGESVDVGVLRWGPLSDRRIRDILISQQKQQGAPRETRIGAATSWLQRELETRGGSARLEDVRLAAEEEGYPTSLLQRARVKLQLVSRPAGTFPNSAVWTLPDVRDEAQSGAAEGMSNSAE
jgi:hypothetical protein